MTDTDQPTSSAVKLSSAAALCEARMRAQPLNHLPDVDCPVSVTDAYVVQSHCHQLLTQSGFGNIAGHKIGCTTSVMQAYLKIDTPCAGKVFDRTVHHGVGEYLRRDLCRPGVECEIAVRLSTDLVFDDIESNDQILLRDQAASAVESAMASIELVDARWVDYTRISAPALIADDFFGAGCVLGDACSIDPHRLDRLTGTMVVNETTVGDGIGSDILGHPLDALVWLAQLRQRQGEPLRASEFVTLGSLVQTQWIEQGDRVDVQIEQLGRVTLKLR